MSDVRIPRPPDVSVKLRVKEIAEQKGVSISALSYGTQISRQQLYKIMSGETRRVDFDTLGRIAYVLNVEIGDLFEVSNEPSEPNDSGDVVEFEGNRKPVLMPRPRITSARVPFTQRKAA